MKKDLPEIWAAKWGVSSVMFNEAGIAVCILPEPKPSLANDNITGNSMTEVAKGAAPIPA